MHAYIHTYIHRMNIYVYIDSASTHMHISPEVCTPQLEEVHARREAMGLEKPS